MTRTRYTMSEKNRIARMYLKGVGTYRTIGKMTDIPHQNVHRWVTGNPVYKTRKTSKLLTRSVTDSILATLTEMPSQTIKEVCERVSLGTGVRISCSTCRRGMKELNLTRKKVYKRAFRDSLPSEKQAFCDASRHIRYEDIVSIDESAIYVDMTRTHGYGPKGRRVTERSSMKRNVKYTILMAVSHDRVVGYEPFKGSCNARIFASFIEGLDIDVRRQHILVDNVAFHKSACVREVYRRRNVSTLFLPPYSPEFQPIEHVFATLKSAYRSINVSHADKTEASITSRVTAALAFVTAPKLAGSFRHCWSLLSHEFVEREAEGDHGIGHTLLSP